MSRQLSGALKWAVKAERPPNLVAARPTRLQKAGLKYEAKFAAAVPEAVHGQWFNYADAEGVWWCQPDFVLEFGGLAVVLEAKLSWRGKAINQLELYREVVAAATGKSRVVGLVVTKSILRLPAGFEIKLNLESAIAAACCRRPVVLQWLGDAGQLQWRKAA